MTAAALVPAAGEGLRLGGGGPKALRTLGGVPLLLHAVRRLAASDEVTLVVVAAPATELGAVRALLVDVAPGTEVRVVAGGATRQESVAAALAEVGPGHEVVLVHDAARALAPTSLVDSVVAAVHAGAAAVVPGLEVSDTVKEVDAAGQVVGTVDRESLRAVQTPQGFSRDLLVAAHAGALADDPATDDAGLVERMGLPVLVVPGSPLAFKVTRPFDLVLGEAVLAAGDDT